MFAIALCRHLSNFLLSILHNTGFNEACKWNRTRLLYLNFFLSILRVRSIYNIQWLDKNRIPVHSVYILSLFYVKDTQYSLVMSIFIYFFYFFLWIIILRIFVKLIIMSRLNGCGPWLGHHNCTAIGTYGLYCYFNNSLLIVCYEMRHRLCFTAQAYQISSVRQCFLCFGRTDSKVYLMTSRSVKKVCIQENTQQASRKSVVMLPCPSEPPHCFWWIDG